MIHDTLHVSRSDREPWLAVSFSWLLPGLGHLYIGTPARGVLLLVVGVLLQVLSVVSFLSSHASLWMVLATGFCFVVVLPIWSCWDAFRIAKARDISGFERARMAGKDPWLGVFLTMLLPGLGHLYLRKWLYAMLLLPASLILRFLATWNWPAAIGAFAVMLLACVHVHRVCSPRSDERTGLTAVSSLALFGTCVFVQFLVPLGIRHFLVTIYVSVGSGSMAPTITKRAHVVVDRFTYRWRNPAVGEVVALVPPKNDYSRSNLDAVKRIVAVGGETIWMHGDCVYIDGKERDFPNRAIRRVAIRSDEQSQHYYVCGVREAYRVPDGCYFVLGDNRPNSLDSRCYGAVPREYIVGRVVKTLWPTRAVGAED